MGDGPRPEPRPSFVIPHYLPLPPLVTGSSPDSCGYGGPGCWSLAPWRSRTVGSPGSPAIPYGTGAHVPGYAAPPPASPHWAFAPPAGVVSKPAAALVPPGVFVTPTGSAAWHAAADRAGCWAFGPTAPCARTE
ncbi:hypothetical protein GCM10009530_34190 [Microbispora corallina]|uniref:Uncharacterized protein n=1 Tax=Microbispora corallina TaxID=83302 RepID=A0ABQ4G1Q8_9ACTN|nr:hypothetical protein Mco01_40060 [Microbispora corallina]